MYILILCSVLDLLKDAAISILYSYSIWMAYFDGCLLNRGNNLMKFISTGFNLLASQFTVQHLAKLSSSDNTIKSYQEVSNI